MSYNVTVSSSILQGSVKIPPSKSLLHRAIICAALSDGETHISPFMISEDISATLSCMSALGATYQIKDHHLIVQGISTMTKKLPLLDVKSSGSTLRFMIPIVSLFHHKATFMMSDSLKNRPLKTYQDLFVDSLSIEDSTLSISSTIQPGSYVIDEHVSSQFISGLLFALPLLESPSTLSVKTMVSNHYVDLTVDVLHHFGVHIEKTEDGYFIPAPQRYVSKNITIEGDFSQAAVFLSAGLFHPYVEVEGLTIESLQADRKIIDIITDMKGKLIYTELGCATTMSPLQSIEVCIDDTPDLALIIALLMSLSKGTSMIRNTQRLTYKETDRALAIVETLQSLGVQVAYKESTIIIQGTDSLQGGTFHSRNDHRLVMMLAIAGSLSEKPITIIDAHAIEKSYPTFFDDFAALGGTFHLVKKEPSL